MMLADVHEADPGPPQILDEPVPRIHANKPILAQIQGPNAAIRKHVGQPSQLCIRHPLQATFWEDHQL